ncbi:MAG TPA: Flp pilus assembly protein CpaB [Acidobacteriaceae bacterium]|nr:Flp pilus assembly protein CpaB [Acidobacteriaceae bacterium]
MNAQRILPALAAALALSGGCTYLLSRKMQAHPAAQAQAEERYAAPGRPLQAGEVLKAEDVEMVSWPRSHSIQGAFSRASDVVGREVLFPLDKGMPILARYLSAPGSGPGLAAKIPDGMRAIALRSDEIVGVAGFLAPGSRVDVLVTYRPENSTGPVTATVLQNAEVIAAGHQLQPDPEGKPSSVTVVTLLLTPEEAERAVMASTQGMVHFVLRNGADHTSTQSPPLLLSALSGTPALRPGRAPKSRRAFPSEPNYEVETILGGKEIPAAPPEGRTKQ